MNCLGAPELDDVSVTGRFGWLGRSAVTWCARDSADVNRSSRHAYDDMSVWR